MQGITYMVTGTEAEYQSDADSKERHPIPRPNVELWGVFVNICEKIDRVLTAPHYIMLD